MEVLAHVLHNTNDDQRTEAVDEVTHCEDCIRGPERERADIHNTAPPYKGGEATSSMHEMKQVRSVPEREVSRRRADPGPAMNFWNAIIDAAAVAMAQPWTEYKAPIV